MTTNDRLRHAPAVQPARQQRPCFVCGTPTENEVCGGCAQQIAARGPGRGYFTPAVACVPDDVPQQIDMKPLPADKLRRARKAVQAMVAESYETRRARLAAERNPQRACDHTRFGPGVVWACFVCGESGGAWPDARGQGVARAVANLSQHEPRCGSARWQP